MLRVVVAVVVWLPVVGRAQTVACGVERWPVKVLMDRDVDSVAAVADPTTIAALLGVPKPDEPRAVDRRSSLERRRFRIRAVLVSTSHEADGDVHLVLADPTNRTLRLVAEIPDPDCALRGRFAADFAEARKSLEGLAADSSIEVEVEGIAFWDDEHGQTGMAPNGIELHPVLRITGVLTRYDILREEVGADPPDPDEVQVWVNLSSKVYHCPGSPYYSNTVRGRLMPESTALRAGHHAAGGRRCR